MTAPYSLDLREALPFNCTAYAATLASTTRPKRDVLNNVWRLRTFPRRVAN